jgi:hypothetical protein
MEPSLKSPSLRRNVQLDGEVSRAIEEWRRGRDPIPSVTDAVRELVQTALKSREAA